MLCSAPSCKSYVVELLLEEWQLTQPWWPWYSALSSPPSGPWWQASLHGIPCWGIAAQAIIAPAKHKKIVSNPINIIFSPLVSTFIIVPPHKRFIRVILRTLNYKFTSATARFPQGKSAGKDAILYIF